MLSSDQITAGHISLLAVAVEALRAHDARQSKRTSRRGYWADLDFIFLYVAGHALAPEKRKPQLLHSIEPAGQPSTVPFHDLRHTYATRRGLGSVSVVIFEYLTQNGR